MRRIIWAGIALSSALTAFGQPSIGAHSVRSVAPTSVENGLARGSAFRITGHGLGPFDTVTADLPYPNELAGTRVRLTQKGGGTEALAYLSEVGAFEIHAVLPSATEPGNYLLEVETGDGRTQAIEVRVSQQNPGIVTTTRVNGGLASVDVLGDEPQRLRMTAPAHPGATLSILAAGFGPIDAADNEDPGEQVLFENAELLVAGRALPVRYAGRYPGRPGFDRLLVDLPDDEELALGCYVPVSLRAGDQVSNAAFLAIAERGADICNPGEGLTVEALRAIDDGQTVVIPGFEILDTATDFSFDGETMEFHTRSAEGAFYSYDRSVLESGAAWAAGTILNRNGCSVVTLENNGGEPGAQEPSGLDAGRILRLNGPDAAEFELERNPLITYSGDLGGSIPVLPGMDSWDVRARRMKAQARRRPTRPMVSDDLPAGLYTLSGAGGDVVAPFSAEVELSTPIQWTNRPSIENIDRNNPLSIVWTPGPSHDVVTVSGLAIGPVSGTPRALGRLFICQAPASDGGLIVPADILSLMPVTDGSDESLGFLSVAHSNTPPNGTFRAPLAAGGETEYGQIGFTYMTQKGVLFQ